MKLASLASISISQEQLNPISMQAVRFGSSLDSLCYDLDNNAEYSSSSDNSPIPY